MGEEPEADQKATRGAPSLIDRLSALLANVEVFSFVFGFSTYAMTDKADPI
jgi:hypothetical protein